MMLAMQQMNAISRRSFLHVSAIGLVGAGYLGANPLGLPIGCQTWPVRQTIGKDLDGTLKELAGMGFERIEMCSPPGYVQMGFGPLAQMKPAQFRDKIHAAGLGELPLWLHGTEGPSRRAAGIRQGARPETNDYLHIWRAEGRQNGGLDARRRRRQQVRRADAESGHTTRLPQPRLRIPQDRRRTDLRQADGRVRSEAGEDAVSGERDQSGLPGGGLLREVSGPVPFDPPAGLVANGEERSRTGAGCGGLEETVCGGQEIGGEELLR